MVTSSLWGGRRTGPDLCALGERKAKGCHNKNLHKKLDFNKSDPTPVRLKFYAGKNRTVRILTVWRGRPVPHNHRFMTLPRIACHCCSLTAHGGYRCPSHHKTPGRPDATTPRRQDSKSPRRRRTKKEVSSDARTNRRPSVQHRDVVTAIERTDAD